MAEKRNAGDGFRGWLAIDKPSNVSSANVVNKVKRAFGARKVGHAGTLDRPATGVLAVALGEATKTIQYITGSRKGYRFTVRFGQATETDDFCGKITDTSELRPSDQEIRSTLNEFVGDVMQVPPAYSAVKVAGKRAYKRAVAGETTILNARPLTMYDLRLIRRLDKDRAEFEMVCGKGGYVRAIARDLGMKLGCFGHVAELRRTWSGPFINWRIALNLKSSMAKPKRPIFSICFDLWKWGWNRSPDSIATLKQPDGCASGSPGRFSENRRVLELQFGLLMKARLLR